MTIKWLSFEEARKKVRSLGFKTREEYHNHCRSERPVGLPSDPAYYYKDQGWNGWPDFLGTEYIVVPFEEARQYARSSGIKNRREWKERHKTRHLPFGIPGHPDRVYKDKGWINWGDFLGTGREAYKDFICLPFEEARKKVRSLGFKSQTDFFNYSKIKGLPKGIPTQPPVTYKVQGWNGWPDFLGYEEKQWSIQRVKELLKDLIDSKIIYDFNEVRLYDLLNSKGVLNISGNRHEEFFKNLVQASRTSEGKKAIEDYVNSDEEDPPNLSSNDEEIQTASPEELADLVNDSEPLDYGNINTPEQILKQTDLLESICVDEEKMQFQVNCSIQDLWKSAFKDQINAESTVRSQGMNGNKFHDAVTQTFISDYDATQKNS